MSSNKNFFAFGDNLDNISKNKTDNMPAEESSSNGIYTCAVCKTKNSTPLCSKCGFDDSRNYEQHPTLQKIKIHTPAVSLFKALWNPPAEPSVEQTIALLRNQRWDDNVLSAIEEILNSAKSGRFNEQQYISVKKSNTLSDRNPELPLSTNRVLTSTKICSVCGTSNNFRNIYCHSCGAKLNTYSAKKVNNRKR